MSMMDEDDPELTISFKKLICFFTIISSIIILVWYIMTGVFLPLISLFFGFWTLPLSAYLSLTWKDSI
jgi:uncharacterized membrane protein (DUF485 family)